MRTCLPMLMLTAAFMCQKVRADDVGYQLEVAALAAHELILDSTHIPTIELENRTWSVPGVEQASHTQSPFRAVMWDTPPGTRFFIAPVDSRYFSLPDWMEESVWPLTRELIESAPERVIFPFLLAKSKPILLANPGH